MFELRALSLLGRHSTTWAIPLVLFAFSIFPIGSRFYAKAGLDSNPPIYAQACTITPNFLLIQMGFY
jgi:hypothetical protein